MVADFDSSFDPMLTMDASLSDLDRFMLGLGDAAGSPVVKLDHDLI